MTLEPAAGFVSPVRRVEAPHVADEKEALMGWLDFHRATLLGKLEGLDDEALRRQLVPSGTSLLGLVKHLTGAEHHWFVNGYARAGEPPSFPTDDDPDADFRIGPQESTAGVVEAYVAMCERSRSILAEADSLDDAVPTEERGLVELRWILLHMIEETARHNGHADILRELIDGCTGP